VLARGNRREAIFRDDRDRTEFLRRLEIVCGRMGWSIRAYVLMGNHYHLVLHSPLPNLVEGMKWFQNAYTRYFNCRHREWGRVFGDRYKSIPVEEPVSFGGRGTARGDYLATLIDYIHLNPARAGLIDPRKGQSLLDYPWSSLAAGYAVAPSKRPKWLDAGPRLVLSPWPDTAAGRRGYVGWLDGRVREEKAERLGLPDQAFEQQGERTTLRHGWYWGSEAFKEWMHDKLEGAAKRVGKRAVKKSIQGKDHAEKQAMGILEQGRERFGWETVESMRQPHRRGDLGRVAIAWAIWRATAMPQGWIAERLGLRSAANVSQWLRRFEALEDRALPKEIKKWKREMSRFDA